MTTNMFLEKTHYLFGQLFGGHRLIEYHLNVSSKPLLENNRSWFDTC